MIDAIIKCYENLELYCTGGWVFSFAFPFEVLKEQTAHKNHKSINAIVDVIIVVVVRITAMAMQTTYIKIDQNKTSCTTLPIVPTVQCCNTIQ